MRTDLRTRMVAAACVAALPWLSAGCTARRHAMVDLVAEAPRSCRPLMAIDAAHARAAAWKTPADPGEREKLDASSASITSLHGCPRTGKLEPSGIVTVWGRITTR